MYFNATIQEKRAKEIAAQIVKAAEEAQHPSERFATLDAFSRLGETIIVEKILQLLKEVNSVHARSEYGKIILAYEDTNRLREYLRSFIPNKVQRAIANLYAEDQLTPFDQ